jgi:hypothetical protein
MVTWNVLLKRRDELKDAHKQDPTDILKHYQYLALELNIKNPPLRSDISNLVIRRQNRKPGTNMINYIWIAPKRTVIVINNDKVSHSHGSIEIGLNDELAQIINDSLFTLPRKYLLTDLQNINRSMSPVQYQTLLRSIFKDKNVSVDVLRSVYITNFYNDPKNTLDKKIILASKMRHSVSVAQRVYHKPNLKEECERVQFDLKQWGEDYRAKNKQQLRDKQKQYYDANKSQLLRKKIINNLNSGNVTAPRDATIKKYKLVLDAGRWR